MAPVPAHTTITKADPQVPVFSCGLAHSTGLPPAGPKTPRENHCRVVYNRRCPGCVESRRTHSALQATGQAHDHVGSGRVGGVGDSRHGRPSTQSPPQGSAFNRNPSHTPHFWGASRACPWTRSLLQ